MKPTEQPDICKTEWEDLLRHLASKPKKKKKMVILVLPNV